MNILFFIIGNKTDKINDKEYLPTLVNNLLIDTRWIL